MSSRLCRGDSNFKSRFIPTTPAKRNAHSASRWHDYHLLYRPIESATVLRRSCSPAERHYWFNSHSLRTPFISRNGVIIYNVLLHVIIYPLSLFFIFFAYAISSYPHHRCSTMGIYWRFKWLFLRFYRVRVNLMDFYTRPKASARLNLVHFLVLYVSRKNELII